MTCVLISLCLASVFMWSVLSQSVISSWKCDHIRSSKLYLSMLAVHLHQYLWHGVLAVLWPRFMRR